MKLVLGDSLDKLKDLPTGTIDCVVTDPPYGLSFMGKKWDHDVPSEDLWREVFRVMKPGAHLLSFFGTRTYHAGVTRIEAAGFEVRDMLAWLYGSGFPKSLDVSKAIDKAAGAEREVTERVRVDGKKPGKVITGFGNGDPTKASLPATDDAKRWQGWGTALKPANEPIVLARKPLEKGLTVAQNVQKWGTGALNIDGTRITGGKMDPRVGRGISYGAVSNPTKFGQIKDKKICGTLEGRWPANVLLSEEAAEQINEQVGRDVAKYFYCEKTSKRERNAGLEGMPEKANNSNNNPSRMVGSSSRKALINDETDGTNSQNSGVKPQANHHPTVKPIRLMEYLCKLVCPPGGIVLDPFMGSGTTGCAAVKLGLQFIGIEREAEYLEIARRRIEHWRSQRPDFEEPDDGQMQLPLEPA